MALVVSFVRSVWLAVLLLIVGVEADFDSENCPCLTLEQKLAMTSGLIQETLLQNFTERLAAGDITQDYIDRFGVGCARHGGNENPWCYIDPNHCDIEYSPSYTIRSLYYSKGACGYPDEELRNTLALQRNDLRVVLHENYRGYQGTYCQENETASYNTCRGTVVELAKELALGSQQSNISLVVTTVPDWIKPKAETYAPFVDAIENMDHAACVYAASIGAVDLCLGAFTKNRHRALISSYLEMGVTSEYLIVHGDVSDDHVWGTIQRIFSPFSWALWAVTFVVLAFLSLLFVVQEHSFQEMKDSPLDQTIGLATFDAVLGFFTTGVETEDDPVTWGGRFTMLAIAVQILLTTASYTANLTNFLVRDGFSTIVNDIDEAIRKRVTVCALRNKITILNTAYGVDRINYATNPVDGIQGFVKRDDLLDAMDRGICTCAILGFEDLEQSHGRGQHCDKQIVGTPVIELPWGIPVSKKYARPLRTLMTSYINEGKWNRIQNEARPDNVCSDQEVDAENTRLEVKHMAGAYVLSGILAFVGVLFTLAAVAKRRRRKGLASARAPPPPTTTTTQSAEATKRPSERSEEDEEIPDKDNGTVHAAIANLKNDISELKQLVIFDRELRGPENHNNYSMGQSMGDSAILFEK